MRHEENINLTEQSDNTPEDFLSIQQKLKEAHNEIAELKLHIAWLERSYE